MLDEGSVPPALDETLKFSEPVGPPKPLLDAVGKVYMLLLDEMGKLVEALTKLLVLVVLLEHVSFAIKSALTDRLSLKGARVASSVLKKQFGPIADGIKEAA